ncbi:C80 family cysteine peptidase [Candidatus Williamhamiltonella defendens]|uniref:C80 family cysteine peptidase n=2 Tax=Candidatus Williamhamiltonella defendens TaxID=138072 RepID=UPI001E64F70B|nr:C80 family cysteine peptidase [Candidatus Hamiltonella defensa]
MTQEQFPRNSFIPPHQSGLPVHRTKRTPTGFVPVTQWDGLYETVMTRSDGGLTRYAGQLIIQLENDPIILDAALRLTEKHPGSVLVQLDQRNHYRVLSGCPKTLQGKLRWQVVGHGNPARANTSPSIRRMSGMNPGGLAELLTHFNQHFSKKYHIDSTPNRISLVGCRLINYTPPNFATQFARAMKRKGILADISARTELVAVADGSGSGKKFTTQTLSEIGAQTAGKTLLLGWNKNGELIQKKHSSAFRLLSPVLDAWAPRYFTDPKIQNKRFRYLVYPSTITDLTSRKGIFSKNIQDKLRQSDLISASILSNQTLRGYTVGVILEVPEQNILAADPDANAIEANLKGAIKKSGGELSLIETNGVKKPHQIMNTIDERSALSKSIHFSELTRNGLLSKQLFSYPQRVATPEDIINNTVSRNTVLITGRTDVNIYPHYPVTENIKITGLFLISSDELKNTGGAPHFSDSEALTSKNFRLFSEAARDIAQELDVELKIIKVSQWVDGFTGHTRNITTEMNQKSSKNLSDMARAQKHMTSSLTDKLKRILILVDHLSSRRESLLSPGHLQLLTEFFHLPSGELDRKKLYQTLSDPLLYSEFTSQVQSLMQLSDAHDQLGGLTGQMALKKTTDWDTFVVENLLNWNERIKVYNHTAEFRAEIHPSVQAIYIDDGSDLAQQRARKVSAAYLSLLKTGDDTLLVKLLNSFQSHAEISAQKIFFPLNDKEAESFRRVIHQMEDASVFVHKGAQNLSQFFNTLAHQTAGYYQLRMGQHILTIAKRQSVDKKIHWSLYDANFGEIRVTTADVQQASHPMRVLLHDYFTRLSGTPQQGGAIVLDVYQLEPTQMLKSASFKKLQSLMSMTDGSLSIPLKPVQTRKNLLNPRFLKLSRTIGMFGEASQGLSWLQSVTCLSHYWRRRSSDELMEPEKQALDFQAKLAMSGLLYDLGSILLTLGFRQLGARIMQKLSYQPVLGVSSRIRGLHYKAGVTVARYGGAFLNMLGAAFDIYQAQKAVTELETETAPDARQDLQVSLALSSLSASISLGSGLAFLALTGQMALMAGAIGIALGMLTAVVGGIYFSVRQVQEIERYTTLTGLQKLRTGWLKFWGAEVDVEVTNQVSKGKAVIEAKKNLVQQCQTHFQTLLDSDTEIETVYYSSGNIMLSEHPYQKLTGKKWTMLIRLGTRYLLEDIKDKILPSQAGAILLEYREKKVQNDLPLYMDLTLEDSQYKFYDIKALSPTDDKISLDTEAHSDGILSLNRLAAPASLSSSDMQSSPPNATNPAKIYFFWETETMRWSVIEKKEICLTLVTGSKTLREEIKRICLSLMALRLPLNPAYSMV